MRRNLKPRLKGVSLALIIGCSGTPLIATASTADTKLAETAIGAFAKICTQPRQKLSRIMKRMERHASEAGYDNLPFEVVFYDTTLEPAQFNVTPGTNRKCQVRFDGNHTALAVPAVLEFIENARFGFESTIPPTHQNARVAGTKLFLARRLQSGPKAVLHVGTANGPLGVQTFIDVERLPK